MCTIEEVRRVMCSDDVSALRRLLCEYPTAYADFRMLFMRQHVDMLRVVLKHVSARHTEEDVRLLLYVDHEHCAICAHARYGSGACVAVLLPWYVGCLTRPLEKAMQFALVCITAAQASAFIETLMVLLSAGAEATAPTFHYVHSYVPPGVLAARVTRLLQRARPDTLRMRFIRTCVSTATHVHATRTSASAPCVAALLRRMGSAHVRDKRLLACMGMEVVMFL